MGVERLPARLPVRDAMKIPPSDIPYLNEVFCEAVCEVLEAYEDATELCPQLFRSSPALPADAMAHLIEVLQRVEVAQPHLAPRISGAVHASTVANVDLEQLGDYGLVLLSQLAGCAAQLGLNRRSRELEALAFPLAVWIARHGGELRSLEPVVKALATLSDGVTDTAELEKLYLQMGEIIDAVSPLVSQDLDKTDPARPWRLLLIKGALVATRSHNAKCMDAAFRSLIRHLPEEAPELFRELMELTETLAYPGQVKSVVERYYRTWSIPNALH
jgi:hypothetical protein